MSDLVGNPEDRFSQNEAHMISPPCEPIVSGALTSRPNGNERSPESHYKSMGLFRCSRAAINSTISGPIHGQTDAGSSPISYAHLVIP